MDLAHCESVEIDRIARDLHLPTDELRLLAGHDPGSADLLYARLTHLEIDVEKIRVAAPDVMRDMQRCCSGCVEKQRCAHELENVPAAAAAYWPRGTVCRAFWHMFLSRLTATQG